MRTICFLYFLCFSFCGFAQDTLSQEQLLEDFDVITDAVAGLSPRLTCEERDLFVQKMYEQKELLKKKGTLGVIDFFKFLASMRDIGPVSLLDGHANFTLHFADIIGSSSVLFPLSLKVIGHELFVNEDKGPIPFGASITAINGVEMAQIMDQIKNLGSYKPDWLEVTFGFHYYLTQGAYNTFAVTYVLPNKKPKTKRIKAVTFTGFLELMNKRMPSEPLVTKYYEKEKAYYLQVNTFNYDKDEAHYKQEMDSLFQAIEYSGAEKLIIDLRQNRGGLIYLPGLLYEHLLLEPMFEQIKLVIQGFSFPRPNYIVSIEGDTIQSQQDIDTAIMYLKNNFIERRKDFYEYNFMRYEPLPTHQFLGEVNLLIAPETFSGATYFAALFKAQYRGKLIGQPPSNSYHGMTAGQTVYYRLPHSGIGLDVPIMSVDLDPFIYNTIKSDTLMPDVLLEEATYKKYFLQHQDADLETALHPE